MIKIFSITDSQGDAETILQSPSYSQSRIFFPQLHQDSLCSSNLDLSPPIFQMYSLEKFGSSSYPHVLLLPAFSFSLSLSFISLTKQGIHISMMFISKKKLKYQHHMSWPFCLISVPFSALLLLCLHTEETNPINDLDTLPNDFHLGLVNGRRKQDIRGREKPCRFHQGSPTHSLEQQPSLHLPMAPGHMEQLISSQNWFP